MARNSECQGRVRREAVWKYTLRKKRKKKKKTFNVREEGKLGLVGSGSGGGPRKRTAPVVAVEGREESKSKSKKRMNVGGVEVLLKVAENCKLTGIQWRQACGAWKKEEKGVNVGNFVRLTVNYWWLVGGGVNSCKGVVMFLGLEFEERERIKGEKKGIVKKAARNRGGLAGAVRTAERIGEWRRVVVNRWQVIGVRRKWAASIRVHEREGEKWDLKKPLGTQPRK